MKNIYFAGSIRGGRADADFYQKMISYMKEKGHKVLTEHVGDLSLNLLEQGKEGDQAIYLQDTGWLKQSELLIGECTTPSLGVGYELAYAEKLEIPCFLFYNRQKTELSAMLTGNSYFKIYPYEKEEEVFRILDEIL